MDLLSQVLGGFILSDFILGSLSAWFNKCFNSQAMKRGLITHSMILIVLVFVTYHAKEFSQYQTYVDMIKYAFIGMYAVSLLEIYMVNGGKVPQSLYNRFDLSNKMKSQEDDGISQAKDVVEAENKKDESTRYVDK